MMHDRRYNIIYADPPWRYRTWRMARRAQQGEKWAHRHGMPPYDCLDTEDICRLPVDRLAAADCVLFLWVTYPMVPAAVEVINAWGFQYRTVAFTWVKENPSGIGFHVGMGFWTRANPEICLLAARGRPKRVSRSVRNLVISPRRDHSRKPDEVRDRIVELCGNLPRIELFARSRSDGWEAWGDAMPRKIDLSFSN
jgi:site-specific DNA-methyltransferase (adenine-specific)